MKIQGRTAKSARNVAVGLLVQGLEIVLRFISRTIFIRCLSVSYLGVNGLFGDVLTLFSLAELGIGGAIVYALYKPLRLRDEAAIGSLIAFYRKSYHIIGSVVLGIGLILLPFLHYVVRNPGDITSNLNVIYLVYLFNVVITYFSSYKFSILNADQNQYIVQLCKGVISILRTIIQSIALLLTHNFYLYLAIESIMIVANNLWLTHYVNRHYPFLNLPENQQPLPPELRQSIFRNVRALFLYKISALLVNNTENILISSLGSLAQVGYYSNYYMFLFLGNAILAAVFSNLGSSIGNLNAEGNRKQSYQIFQIIHLMNFLAYSVVSIAYYTMVSDVITCWIGREFILNKFVVLIISLNFYVKGMQSAVWVFKDTFGLFRYGQYMGLVQAGLTFLFSFLLGKRYEMGGILAGSLLARFCITVWYDPYALFKHGFDNSPFRYYLSYLREALMYVAALFLAVYGTAWLDATSWPLLFYKAVFAGLIPAVFLVLCYHRTSAFHGLQGHLRGFLLKKSKKQSSFGT